MTIELLPLCTFKADLNEPFDLGATPAGGRMIFEVRSGRVDGERLSGSLKGSANADWLTVGADGTGTVDVRALLETDDGALVFVQYQGRVDLTTGTGSPIFIAPRFDTGDARYGWLNRVQALGKGVFDGQTLIYEVYEAT